MSMENFDLERELVEQRVIIERILVSTEKTRRYFQWSLIITIIVIVIPLIASLFLVPVILGGLGAITSGDLSSLGL